MTARKPAVRNGARHPVAGKSERRLSDRLHGLGLLLGLLFLGACEARQQSACVPCASSAAAVPLKPEESRMWMVVGERRFVVILSDNATGQAFAKMLPLTLDMAELNGNEKHAELQKALPANATRIEMISNGDLLLYGSKTLVIFYQAFTSPYSYSNVGGVVNPLGLAHALGEHGVRVQFLKYR
ncbi:cyclophilin-like fold protein [Janthinobacterium tructae]|uniref:cyclophilin-like fold protein n=1 Tax=Janthinobacterium tructae TaxID=2590869 RepID=UPI00249C5331|nr:cyclophilin-like fold protein [Janthinobacterium tructae]MDI3292814.1 cyclophilin-like fold protein [Janthinobacterium tructae]